MQFVQPPHPGHLALLHQRQGYRVLPAVDEALGTVDGVEDPVRSGTRCI
jgi:hypothetical protein